MYRTTVWSGYSPIRATIFVQTFNLRRLIALREREDRGISAVDKPKRRYKEVGEREQGTCRHVTGDSQPHQQISDVRNCNLQPLKSSIEELLNHPSRIDTGSLCVQPNNRPRADKRKDGSTQTNASQAKATVSIAKQSRDYWRAFGLKRQDTRTLDCRVSRDIVSPRATSFAPVALPLPVSLGITDHCACI